MAQLAQAVTQLPSSVQELVDIFPTVAIAQPTDNQRILDFIEAIPMQTAEGGMRFDRNPNFFALKEAQGEVAFTFLFLNANGTVGGIGCISIIPMMIQGRQEYLGYNSDLRLSRNIDRETRKEFYQFYEMLMRSYHNLSELKGCRFVVASILNGNKAAERALVKKKSKKASQLVHRPFYNYENINVMARLPRLRKPFSVTTGDRVGREAILKFLTTGDQKLGWTREEILRRQQVTGFLWSQFMVILDENEEIVATSLLLDDQAYRKLFVTELPKALKFGQKVLPLVGRPGVAENEAVRVGYLCFVKSATNDVKVKAAHIASFLHRVFDEMKAMPIEERYHCFSLQVCQTSMIRKQLYKYGLMASGLRSTLYQVIHEENLTDETRLPEVSGCQDFDLVFH